MKKITIILILLIIVCSAVVIVLTFSTATLASPAKIKIIPSDNAILALNPGSDPAYMVTINNGVLDFNFTFLLNLEQVYEFDELFWVTNNSTEKISFTMHNDGINYISVKPSLGNNYFIKNGINQDNYYTLASGESITLKVIFDVPEDAQKGDIKGSLNVITCLSY